MWYNSYCLDSQNTRALCFSKAATGSTIVYCGQSALHERTNVLAGCLGNGGTREGHFAMATLKWVLRKAANSAKKRAQNEKLHSPGIYKIVNRVNGHCYVGQSVDLFKRRTAHFGNLRAGTHQNKYLQHAFNHYGEASFRFEIIEFIENDFDLNDREQYWIDHLKSEYNLVRDISEGSDRFMSDRVDRAIELSNDQEETFVRPAWHAWVYGGDKNSQLRLCKGRKE